MLAFSLDDEAQAELLEHITNCEVCSRKYEAADKTMGLIKPSIHMTASQALKERLKSAIGPEQMPKPQFSRIKRAFKYLAYSAAAVILLVVASVSLHLHSVGRQHDELWFDNTNKRFKRIFSIDGYTVYACAYDGETLEMHKRDSEKKLNVSVHNVGPSFATSEISSRFLGGSPGGRMNFAKVNARELDEIYTFSDGANAHSIKVTMKLPVPILQEMTDTYWIFRINETTGFLQEMEFIIHGDTVMTVRNVSDKYIDNSYNNWMLSDDARGAASSSYTWGAYVLDDMVLTDVSLEHMAEKADFENYAFSGNPYWVRSQTIVDLLDIVHPPKRMFLTVCESNDGRDMLLVQSPFLASGLGKMKKMGKVTYESPDGYMFWHGFAYKWVAKIFFSSTKSILDSKSKGPDNGYYIETPSATCLFLAVKGKLEANDIAYLSSLLKPTSEIIAGQTH